MHVRMKGLEPPRRKAQDPKSCASTNSATSAYIQAANLFFFNITGKSLEHGAWSMEHGAWGMGHGAWGVEHGVWSMG